MRVMMVVMMMGCRLRNHRCGQNQEQGEDQEPFHVHENTNTLGSHL